jgi:hypothetical protein
LASSLTNVNNCGALIDMGLYATFNINIIVGDEKEQRNISLIICRNSMLQGEISNKEYVF